MSLKDTCLSAWDVVPAAIGAGQSLSEPLNLGGLRLFGIVIPAEWTAASLSFQVSPDAGTSWFELVGDSGENVAVTSKTASCMMVDPKLFAPFQYIRIRSGLASAAVSQISNRTLQLFLRSI